ncbi:MAG: hypothetical protein PHT94_00820 [Candidatus Nanoarchaeia archaeon]|nr:hypothetical protein [Candidatus Nanoarchaeia archaeon]
MSEEDYFFKLNKADNHKHYQLLDNTGNVIGYIYEKFAPDFNIVLKNLEKMAYKGIDLLTLYEKEQEIIRQKYDELKEIEKMKNDILNSNSQVNVIID